MEIKTTKEIVETTINMCMWQRNKRWVAVDDLYDSIEKQFHGMDNIELVLNFIKAQIK